MNPSPLDDRLHRLADQVTAPPTAAARQAITRKAGVLRRRRRVRNAVGGGVLALAVVAGGLALMGEPADDVETDPSGPAGRGSMPLPALTVELAGWQIVTVEDTVVPADLTPGEDPVLEGTLQVFRRSGDLAGPSVALHHQAASGAVGAEPGDRTVAVGDADGYLRRTGEQSLTLRWSPDDGDTYATLQAWGLSEGEVVELATGLRRKDDDIAFPPSADDEFGFVAGQLPAGIEEDPIDPVDEERPGLRRLVLEAGEATAEVVIDDGGEPSFEAELADLLATAGDVEAMSVLQRPAVAVEHPDDGRWSLVWRHTGQSLVTATLDGVDSSTVADVAAAIREVPGDEWRDMLAEHR